MANEMLIFLACNIYGIWLNIAFIAVHSGEQCGRSDARRHPVFWLVENFSTVRCICCHWIFYPKINFQLIRICLTHTQFRWMTVGHVSFHWKCITLHRVKIEDPKACFRESRSPIMSVNSQENWESQPKNSSPSHRIVSLWDPWRKCICFRLNWGLILILKAYFWDILILNLFPSTIWCMFHAVSSLNKQYW